MKHFFYPSNGFIFRKVCKKIYLNNPKWPPKFKIASFFTEKSTETSTTGQTLQFAEYSPKEYFGPSKLYVRYPRWRQILNGVQNIQKMLPISNGISENIYAICLSHLLLQIAVEFDKKESKMKGQIDFCIKKSVKLVKFLHNARLRIVFKRKY
jgi:hypothetical protein